MLLREVMQMKFEEDFFAKLTTPSATAAFAKLGIQVMRLDTHAAIPAETKNALARIRELPDNWDGDGASVISPHTVERAEELIRDAFVFAPDKLRPPSVAPGYGGMIVIEWSDDKGSELILDVLPDEPVRFLLMGYSLTGCMVDGIIDDRTTIQELISRYTLE